MPTRPTLPFGLALAAFAGGLCLATAALAQTAAPAAPPSPGAAPVAAPPSAAAATPATATLTGAEAWKALLGNTITGRGAGTPFSEYFDPSGTVKYADTDGLSTGKWAQQGDRICIDFPDDDDRTCPAFEVNGTSGTATEDGGGSIPFDILPGNAKGL